MGDAVRIALCQTEIVWENKEENIRNAEAMLKDAAGYKADMVLFPEMSFTGFSMDTAKTAENDRQTVGRMKDLATKYDICVGFGWVCNTGNKAQNRYSVISPTGELLAEYTKIHSFRYGGECDQFSQGDATITFEYKGIKITPFICYDLRFPELFRKTVDGTDVYLIPANWPKRRSEHWKALLKARAIENQAYVLGINCVGDIGGLEYSGDTSVIDPLGIICEEISGKPGIIMAEVDKDALAIRGSFPVLEDRRTELYGAM